jgi:hypothetical protein
LRQMSDISAPIAGVTCSIIICINTQLWAKFGDLNTAKTCV